MVQSSAATSLAARPSLTLTRRLRARPEKVYAAWTDPLNLVQWFAQTQAKPGSIKAELDRATRFAAGVLGFATQEEVSALRSTIQSLEDNLAIMESRAGHNGAGTTHGAGR